MDKHSAAFIQALTEGDKKSIQRIPKTDLHNHAGLGLKLTALSKFAKTDLPAVPKTISSIAEMNQYIQTNLYPIYATRSGFEFAIEEAIQEAASDGITYLEASIDCYFLTVYDNDVNKLSKFINKIKNKYAEKVKFSSEIGISRDIAPVLGFPLMESCIESGAFECVDLYGTELAREPQIYKQLFRKAADKGLKLKAHVGEFGNAELIRRTCDILEVTNVQHGISAAENKEVMQWLARNNITLNICPTSNIRLLRVNDYSVHPIRKLFDAGIAVTINTDDLLFFESNVSDEYLQLFNSQTLSAAELNSIRIYGLQQQKK